MSKDQAKKSMAETNEGVAKTEKAEANGKKFKGKKANGKKPKGKPEAKPVARPSPKAKPAAKPATEAPLKSVHADEPQREVVWSDRRVAVVKAMRQLDAVSAETARTAGEIAGAAGIPEDEVFRVKTILDVYRTNELLHNGYAKSVRLEGERGLRYYLTPKGETTDFPQKKKGELKVGE
jgi:hypothetical protein